MRGSLYPNGCLVDQSALRYTELSKSEEILRGRTSLSSRGVYSGLDITINAIDNTKIDVALGSGFAPNGDYILTTSNYLSISLDDYTASAINYVCAVRTEINSFSQSHESDGSTYPTRAEMAWRIRVYEESVYNALSLTDANLANDARDRMIILGKVSANGAGNPITTSDITSPTAYNNVLYATPSELVTITGVTVMGVSSGTATGTGNLTWTVATGNFQWTPAVGGVGPNVNVTADGYYNFTDGAGEYIRCYIVFSQLPVANQNENIVITNLYYQAIPRLTGEDTYHRNLLGTGVVSPNNAHGMSIADLAGDALPQLEEHQDVMHCNGIWRFSTAGALGCSVDTFPATADSINISAPAAGDLFYINGNKLDSISALSIPFASWVWGVGYNTRTNYFEIYLNDQGDPLACRKAAYPPARNLTGTWIVDMSPSYPAANYNLSYRTDATYTYLKWSNGVEVAILNTDFAGAVGSGRVIRLFEGPGYRWIDLYVSLEAKGATDNRFNSNGGPLTDSIEVSASPDWDANMPLCGASYWWDTVSLPNRGSMGYNPTALTRRLIDKRTYGSLSGYEINDGTLQYLNYHPQDEMHYSGVLLNRFGPGVEFRIITTPIVGLSVNIAGGPYYCRGRRLISSNHTVSLVDNTTNLVWADMDGNYQVIDVGAAPYSGSVRDALRYVVGSFSYIPEIDDDTHNTDILDSPERGVALWLFETSGAAVSYYESMARNINGPVDPWSVAEFVTSGCASAFNSLYTAFEYARVAQPISISQRERFNIDISIVGYTSIVNQRIVQPAGVNVRGGRGLVGAVWINIAHASGVWQLSSASKVSDVDIYLNVDDTAVFGLATAAVANSNGAIIEDCRCYTLAKTGTVFTCLYEAGFAGSILKNVTVRNNIVTMHKGFVTYGAAVIDYKDIDISSNTISADGNSTIYAIGLEGQASADTDGIIIAENKIEAGLIIYLKNVSKSTVRDNKIIMGRVSGVTAIKGVDVQASKDVSIYGNAFSEKAGNTSTDLRGIEINSVDRCSVHNNSMKDMIYGVHANIINECGIHNNNIKDTQYGVFGTSLSRCTVHDNTFKDGNYGIRLVNADRSSVHDNTIEGFSTYGITMINSDYFSVHNNAIYDVTGYGVDLDTSNDGTIEGNSIGTALMGIRTDNLDRCTIGSNTINDVRYGISDQANNASSYLNIHDNVINADESGAVGGIGIFTRSNNTVISNNIINSESIGIGCMGTAVLEIIGNRVYNATKVGGALNAYGIGASHPGGSYCIAIEDGYSSFSIISNDVQLTGVGGALLANSACIYIGDGCNYFTVQSCKTSLGFVTSVAGGGNAWHIYVVAPGVGNFSVKDCHVDNRTGTSANSPMNGLGITLLDDPTNNTIGHICGNTIDGSNNYTGAAPFEFYVSKGIGANGPQVTVGENSVFDVTQASPVAGINNTPNISLAAVGVLSSGNNRSINTDGPATHPVAYADPF